MSAHDARIAAPRSARATTSRSSPGYCCAVRVAINEALEIARRFSTYEATQFINGILDAIKRDLDRERPQEETSPHPDEETGGEGDTQTAGDEKSASAT